VSSVPLRLMMGIGWWEGGMGMRDECNADGWDSFL
jgi:hypothetical protein